MDLTKEIKVFQSECCNGWHCKHEDCFVGEPEEKPEGPDIRQFCGHCKMGIYHFSQQNKRIERETKAKHTEEGPQFMYTGYQYCDGQYKYEYVNTGEIFGSITEPVDDLTINQIGLQWLAQRPCGVEVLVVPEKIKEDGEKKNKQTKIDKFLK
ncbi:Hypothetical predicted protein [Paramuricea clavata]|uniref:Uncharacterized protein n=1 Tax=Paramuricea clavata TaxID=317549 RepID=A0A6S7G0T5_PARCT|nr:Hypothetical predicted protein [Paramuricea clavata]